MSVGIHLISPGSKGLFHQAMMESDPSSMYYRTLDDMALYGADFCSLLKCSYVHALSTCTRADARMLAAPLTHTPRPGVHVFVFSRP